MLQEKEKKTTKSEYINRAFVCLTALIFIAGLARTVFAPEDINKAENRYANKIAKPTLSGYLDGSFQKSVSGALNDQVHFSALAKKWYNRATALLAKPLTEKLASKEGTYVAFRDGIYYRDMLLYYPTELKENKPLLDARAEDYNSVFAAHPELDFYVYYIEKDNDIDFLTGEKMGAYDYLKLQLDLPEDHIARFAIDDFETYQQYFYRTDHHWNYRGSYEGYRGALALVSGDAPIEPTGQLDTDYVFSGSKAASIGGNDVYTDPVSVYLFDLPEMELTCDGGTPIVDYGAVSMLVAKTMLPEDVSYGTIYGWDGGEIIFDTKQPEKENILIIGESYDNAILKLLASHFNKTFSIDLRNYEVSLGKPFDFTAYAAENDIDKVLLIGSMNYFTSDVFEIGGSN